jgi:hypothetical protein
VLTSSSHLDLGLPTFLLPLIFAYKSRMSICSSSMRCTWPAHRSLNNNHYYCCCGCSIWNIFLIHIHCVIFAVLCL